MCCLDANAFCMSVVMRTMLSVVLRPGRNPEWSGESMLCVVM